MMPLKSSVALLVVCLAGCERLGLGEHAAAPEVPSEQALQKISYLPSADSGPKGRKLFDHVEQAHSCEDYELAMRWNRPPNIEGGLFHKKMVYLTGGVPADLPKDSEVFLRGRIERADNLAAGGILWVLALADGSRAQAIEASNFLQKQDETAQESRNAALVKPNKAGRMLCGQGVYQGRVGKAPDEADNKLPLVSMMFAMDRDR
jgi:hypothetical protein